MRGPVSNVGSLIARPQFWSALSHSAEFGAVTCMPAALIAIGLSLALKFTCSRRTRLTVFWLLIAPLFANYYLRTFSTKIAIGETGVWPMLWSAVTGRNSPPHVVFTTGATIVCLLLAAVPYAFIPAFISINGILDKQIVAAYNLGATFSTIFRTIVWRHSKRGLAASVIFAFVFAFGDHVTQEIIGGNTTYIMPAFAVDLWKNNDFPLAAAVALIRSIIVMSLIFLANDLVGSNHAAS